MDDALQDAARAGDVGAVRHDLVGGILDLGAADGAAVGGLERPLLAGAPLAHGSEHLRDHFARPGHLHPVALANVLGLDQVEVVERGRGHRDAADLDRLEHGVRIERPCAPHVDADFLQFRDLDLGCELAGDRPARLAVAHGAQLGMEQGRERRDLRVGCGEVGDQPVVRLDGITPGGELLEQLVLGSDREPLAGRLDVEAEDPQAPAAGDLGIELAQGSGRGVAGIGERRLALLLALLVQLREARLGEVDLAPHLHSLGPALAAEPERDVRDGA